MKSEGPAVQGEDGAVKEAGDDRDAVLHELRVQQFALEQQIEEVRASQQDLAEARDRYADLYDLAPIAYFLLNGHGHVTEANLTTAAFLNIERGNLLGQALVSYLLPSDQLRFRQHLQRCATERTAISDEFTVAVRGKGHLPVQVASTPVFDRRNEVTGFRTALADISALKQSEMRLRLLVHASRALISPLVGTDALQQVVSMIVPPLADICLVDLIDENDGRPARRVAAALSDPAHQDPAGRHRKRVPTTEGWSAHAQVLATGRAIMVENCATDTLAFAEHEPLVFSCQAQSLMYVPLIARGAKLGVMTLLMTKDGRRFCHADFEAAQELALRMATAIDNGRLQEQLKRTVQDRDDLLAFVSHDLRNPLTGVFLTTETLLRSTPPNERRRGWVHLDRILRGVQQVRRMVDDLLDVSSIDSGHFVPHSAEHDIAGILREAVELHGATADRQKLTLAISSVASELCVRCDRARVVQVLSNLIGNAVKFTPEGGAITLSAVANDQNQVVVAVADTGPGILPTRLPHVFERYWQAEDGAHKGRGLGLYIAKGIIEAQGGRIWVESKIGEGATFFFTLAHATRSTSTRPAQASNGGRQKREQL
jgi:PAS domain S-box-containing protein